MNNDFIQELKEKRERYGVSQSRLAVACGVSREYYNRIENGKTQLTEALKGEIQKQLERFNPEEPLFLLIDYFRVRFPTTDVQTVIQKTMRLKEKYFLHEEYGKYGYEESYSLGDIQVMVSHNEVLGVLMELKGKGCRQMESYLLAQERSWYDFMMDCLTAGGVIKRLDLAVNDCVGILNIPKLIKKWEHGEAVSRFRGEKAIREHRKMEMIFQKAQGIHFMLALQRVNCISAFMKKTMNSTTKAEWIWKRQKSRTVSRYD